MGDPGIDPSVEITGIVMGAPPVPPPPTLPPWSDELQRRLALYDRTDLGNAERFRDRYRRRLLFCAKLGWLWWDQRRWCREGADGQVALAVHVTIRAIMDEANAIRGSELDVEVSDGKKKLNLSDALAAWSLRSASNSRMLKLPSVACAMMEVGQDQLDCDPFALNCLNGTLFFRRPGQPIPRGATPQPGGYLFFRSHDPDDRITKLAPVPYDPNVAAAKWEQFLSEVQPQPAMRRQLAIWRGLSLTGDTSEQKLCLFHGSGQNGKSVFEETCAFVAGDYAATIPVECLLDLAPSRAGQPTPDLAQLPGVRMLRTSEPGRNSALNESLVKRLCGGEPITARHLHRDAFSFYPQFKLTISANHLPKIRDSDTAIWRRVLRVPWGVTISETHRNLHLSRELRAEGSGILNWMLNGISDWFVNGLVLAAETREATDEYREDSDTLGSFLESCTIKRSGVSTQSLRLYQVYRAWCTVNGIAPWTVTGLGRALGARAGYRKDKSNGVMMWRDLELTKTVADFTGEDREDQGADGEDIL